MRKPGPLPCRRFYVRPEPCDLLKVPHHGVFEKATKEFASATSPSFAVITSSKDEKEDDETVHALEDAGAEVYLTRKGTVTAVTDGSSLTVSQE